MSSQITVTLDREAAEALQRRERLNDEDQNWGEAEERGIAALRAALHQTPSGEEWRVGQILRHPMGSEWLLIEHIGGEEDDWRAKCVKTHPGGGSVTGFRRIFHREYMDRSFTVVTQPSGEECENCGGSGEVDAMDDMLAANGESENCSHCGGTGTQPSGEEGGGEAAFSCSGIHDDLAEQAMVERGAEAAFFQDDLGGHISGKHTWDTIPETGREEYRKLVRAVLAAAHPHDQEAPQGECPTCGSDDPAFAFDPIRPEQPRRPLIWRDSIGGANYWCPDDFHRSQWEEDQEAPQVSSGPDPAEGLPDDLVAALREPGVFIPADARLWEMIGRWRDAPSNTVSADPLPPQSPPQVSSGGGTAWSVVEELAGLVDDLSGFPKQLAEDAVTALRERDRTDSWLRRSLDRARENIEERPDHLRPARYRAAAQQSPPQVSSGGGEECACGKAHPTVETTIRTVAHRPVTVLELDYRNGSKVRMVSESDHLALLAKKTVQASREADSKLLYAEDRDDHARRADAAEGRIDAAIKRVKRIEDDRREEAATTPVTFRVMQARGEVQAATYLRELLEEPLPDPPSPKPSTRTDEERKRLLGIADHLEWYAERREPSLLTATLRDRADFLRTLAGKEQR